MQRTSHYLWFLQAKGELHPSPLKCSLRGGIIFSCQQRNLYICPFYDVFFPCAIIKCQYMMVSAERKWLSISYCRHDNKTFTLTLSMMRLVFLQSNCSVAAGEKSMGCYVFTHLMGWRTITAQLQNGPKNICIKETAVMERWLDLDILFYLCIIIKYNF